ncbi:MAG: CDP-alcohol phosphatidyltransferase family protein [Candidatus Bathyarchaeota archaeon]|nr:CDP-alcohol phosphatidyltransferase family protein [Candidatus Bathyarchaeota archaeon]
MNNTDTKILLPAAISSLRVAVLPFFVYLFTVGNIYACLGLLAFAAATDFFDGYLARKLRVASGFGAFLDAATDFVLMFGVFVFFTVEGFYPVWLPLLIVASFVIFVVTSRLTQKVYDLVGKYMGSALYIGVVLTLLLPTQAVYLFVQYAYLGFWLVSLASRIISLSKKA